MIAVKNGQNGQKYEKKLKLPDFRRNFNFGVFDKVKKWV